MNMTKNCPIYRIIIYISICLSTFIFVREVKALDFSEHFNGAARIDGESSWIYADGQVVSGDTEKFSKFLEGRTLWRNQRVVLNSGGGSVDEGIKLGRLIREMGFRTAVSKSVREGEYSEVRPGICASACVLAFAGGVERGASEGSLIGVHQLSQSHEIISKDISELKEYIDNRSSDIQIYFGLILMHYMDMGIDPSIIPMMTGTAPDDIRWLTSGEVHSTKIAFAPNEFGPWRVEAYRKGLVAFSRSADERKQLTIYCSAGSTRYRLRISGEPHSTSFLNHAKTLQNFVIAGTEVSNSESLMEIIEGTLTISGLWPGNSDVPDYQATFSLFGQINGTLSDIYSLYHFNSNSFSQSVKLAQNNCI